jgi:transcriptional regulator with XRE-family HTH domain
MKEQIKKHIGSKIREVRKSKGYRQGQMAEMLGFSRANYVNMENGKTAIQVDKIYLLCCLFNIQVADLFPPMKDIKIKTTNEKITVIKLKKHFKPLNVKL